MHSQGVQAPPSLLERRDGQVGVCLKPPAGNAVVDWLTQPKSGERLRVTHHQGWMMGGGGGTALELVPLDTPESHMTQA